MDTRFNLDLSDVFTFIDNHREEFLARATAMYAKTPSLEAVVDRAYGLLVEAIGYSGSIQMPPRGKLDAAEIAALTDWVKLGAPWPESRRVRSAEDESVSTDLSSMSYFCR